MGTWKYFSPQAAAEQSVESALNGFVLDQYGVTQKRWGQFSRAHWLWLAANNFLLVRYGFKNKLSFARTHPFFSFFMLNVGLGGLYFWGLRPRVQAFLLDRYAVPERICIDAATRKAILASPKKPESEIKSVNKG
jgi:hypothetical protein